jgi:hypothetical protein
LDRAREGATRSCIEQVEKAICCRKLGLLVDDGKQAEKVAGTVFANSHSTLLTRLPASPGPLRLSEGILAVGEPVEFLSLNPTGSSDCVTQGRIGGAVLRTGQEPDRPPRPQWFGGEPLPLRVITYLDHPIIARAAFRSAVEQYPNARVRLRDRALVMEEHLPSNVNARWRCPFILSARIR